MAMLPWVMPLVNATGDTLTVWAPLVWAATTTTYGIDLDAATLSTADIRLSDGATIFNTDANTLTITEATVAISGNETVAGTLGVTGTSTLATTTIGSGTNIAKILFGTITIDPQSINATTSGATSTSVTGAVSGMRCFLEPPAALEDDLVPKGCVTGDGTVTIYLYNADNAAVNGTARDWGYLLIK